MITAITKALTSNALTAMATNTSSQMISETTLKAIGRPGAILVDNKISDDTKKYAAAKEFLYQATCLLVFATIIVPVFKHGTFKMAKTARINRYNIWIPAVSALLIWLLGFSPIYVIILSGLGGYIYGRYKRKTEDKSK